VTVLTTVLRSSFIITIVKYDVHIRFNSVLNVRTDF